MDNQPNEKPSMKTEAIAVLLAVGLGAGIGYALLLATGNVVVGIGAASPIALLVNNFVRNSLSKGKS